MKVIATKGMVKKKENVVDWSVVASIAAAAVQTLQVAVAEAG